MGNYLNVGNEGFAAAVADIYVDKTELIKFINSTIGTKNKLTAVSRPRRFGKSYAAQMLCAYYDKSCDSHGLFEGLAISADALYEKYLNQFDVVYLDITWFISSADHIEDTVRILREKVTEELREAYPAAKKANTVVETLAAIYALTGNKFIFIIDEWDALFREAKGDTELQEEYIKFLRGLFKNSGFTDKVIAAAYMTGILPIKRYGNQSAVSDFREYTMLAPKKLAKYVGFTEEEVRSLCEQYGMDFAEMKYWYDGYSLGKVHSVYSPNSVMEAIQNEEFGSYWTRTETYESLKIYIDLDMDGLRGAIIRMLAGEREKIDAETFQNDMQNIKTKDDIITLLIHLGYLAYDSERKAAYIPNEEVKKEFIRAVAASRHEELVKLVRDSERLLERTLAMDGEAVAAAIAKIHKDIGAPLAYNNEAALRSTIRRAYLACDEDFIREEELPGGHGYADIVFRPKRGSAMPAILVELKWNRTAEAAIGQIRERDYPSVLKNYGGDILLVGINYDEKTKKHTCRIEKYVE